MIHVFSVFFLFSFEFPRNSSLLKLPTSSQLDSPEKREFFQAQASLAWGMRAPVKDKRRTSDGACRGTGRTPNLPLLQRALVPACTYLPSLRFRDREHMHACSVMSKSLQPWTIAHQTPLFMGFPREEYWSEVIALLPRIFPTQGLNPRLPTLKADSLLSQATKESRY